MVSKSPNDRASVIDGMPESPLTKIWSLTMETVVAAVVGVDKAVVGVDKAVVGVDKAVVGVDEMVVGIDETVVGEGVGMDVSDSDK